MDAELNRKSAKRIAGDPSLVVGVHNRGLLEEMIFTELQIAQKRGEVLAAHRARNYNCTCGAEPEHMGEGRYGKFHSQGCPEFDGDHPEIVKSKELPNQSQESLKVFGNVKGGRGKCRYCGECHDNVALHEAHYCEKREVK